MKTSFWVEKNILQLEVTFSTSKCGWNVVETIVENLGFSLSVRPLMWSWNIYNKTLNMHLKQTWNLNNIVVVPKKNGKLKMCKF